MENHGKRWRKIRFRLLAFGVTMSILPFLLLGYFQIRASKTDLQKAIQKHNMLVAHRTSEEVARLTENMTGILKTVARLEEPQALEGTWEENKSLLFSVLKMSPYFEEVSIFSQDGREMARVSRREVVAREDLKPRVEVDLNNLTKEGIYIGPVYLTADGSPVVDMAVAFENPAGNLLLGGLRAQVSLRSVMEKITSLHIGQGAYIFMVDGEGRLIGHEDFSQVLKHRQVTASAAVRAFLMGVDGDSLPVPNRYQSYTGQEVLGVFAPVQGVDWGVVIEQPLDQAFRPISLLVMKFLLATAMVIVVVTAISIYFGLRFTKPIEVLEQGVKRVGRGDLNYVIPVEIEDEIGRLVTTFNQMTKELKSKTDKLNFEKERLDTIVSGIGVGLILVDQVCRVHWANPHADKWQVNLGMGQQCYLAVNHQGHPCPGCPVTGGSSDSFGEEILTWVMVEGKKRYFRHRVYYLAQAGPEEPRFLEIMEDITEEKEMEEAMLQTDKLAAVGLLASGVAHEINNPLGTVTAYTEYLQEKRRSNSLCQLCESGEFDQYLQIIQKQIGRCATITRNLLNFSRQTTDRIENININNLLEDALLLLKYQLDRKEIQVRKIYTENLPLVKGDYTNMQQAFLNLLTNAVDALSESGTLALSTSGRDGMVEVVINDNGHGISEEHLSRIFEPFFTTKPVGQGTGLGLSISYGIITKLQGQIQVASLEGQGSTVTVRLPAETTAGEGHGEEGHNEP
ncbi:hypothetical protein SY88_07890 [Clostridiales bacterium PH28_bin88]|nr:hypothetical protein SY88_07890 [Clostridiales bacterium PH28_bin88]